MSERRDGAAPSQRLPGTEMIRLGADVPALSFGNMGGAWDNAKFIDAALPHCAALPQSSETTRSMTRS